jgi:radical SAM superfamily enzyme YgiQ (UPF0313 family)
MTDLILTHGYFLMEDDKEQKIMKPYAPLGLMYLSAYLKSQDFSVEIFDTTFSDRAALEEYLKQHSGGILGIYTNLITRSGVIRIMEQAKKNGFTVILGGPESANYPEKYLQHGADIIVLGEGEEALAELIPIIQRRELDKLRNVEGIVFRDSDNTVVRTNPRAASRDISSYPWPDREAIDINRYLSVWREHHGIGSISMITARGCPYRCTWCSHAVFGYTHRRRTPVDCADELKHLLERYHPDQIWYADDVFTINHSWLFKYANELKNRRIKIPFETISRADRLMKPEVLDTLAEIGCDRIWIGSESGSQRILDAMQRDVTVEQVQWATRQLQARGIKVGMFLMWGYGDETVHDIEMTVEHVKRTKPDVFFTTVAYPIKGTPFYDAYADSISLAGEWSASTDRDYQLGSQRSREYYQAANTYIFNAVEAERWSGQDDIRAADCRDRANSARQYLYDYEKQSRIHTATV